MALRRRQEHLGRYHSGGGGSDTISAGAYIVFMVFFVPRVILSAPTDRRRLNIVIRYLLAASRSCRHSAGRLVRPTTNGAALRLRSAAQSSATKSADCLVLTTCSCWHSDMQCIIKAQGWDVGLVHVPILLLLRVLSLFHRALSKATALLSTFPQPSPNCSRSVTELAHAFFFLLADGATFTLSAR